MLKTLILYHSGYGQTRKISEYIRDRMRAADEPVESAPLDASDLNLADYERIVLGASIRNGKHKPLVHDFIRRNLDLLRDRPSAFFSVNLVARKPEKNTPETNPYVKTFAEQCPWTPDLLGVFAGNLDYRRYRFSDRHIIRFIMWLTGGPTAPDTCIEFTNWDEVDRFADRLTRLGDSDADQARQAA